MTKITNKTPHPYDIHTMDGVKVIPAFGTLEAEFDPAYLELIRLSFEVEESSHDDEGQGLVGENIDATPDLDRGGDLSGQPEGLGDEVGEEPGYSGEGNEAVDAQSQETQPDSEDGVHSSAEDDPAEQAGQVESEESEPLDPKAEYKALTGKKPDGRWSESRILTEIEKLKS